MNRRSILTKTGKGLMEATGKTSNLSRDLRNLLKDIDGKVSVSELVELDRMAEAKLLDALNGLERDGYIREFVAPADDGARSPIGRTSGSNAPSQSGEDLDFTSFKPNKSSARAAENARLQAQAEEIARQAQATRAREAAAAKAKAEAAARARAEAQQKARPAADVKPQAISPTEALDRARREAEERQRREAEEKERREAEARARIEAELSIKRQADDGQRREQQEQFRRVSEEKREAEEKSRLEAEERARREIEELTRREIELRRAREEAERRKREEDERIRREIEERERRKREEREQAERRARLEAEARARREEEERARREEEEIRERERRRRAEEEARKRREAEELENLERSLREQEEQARRDAEQAEREAEARREEEEERHRQEEEEERDAREEARRAREEEKAQARAEAKEAARQRRGERSIDRASEESWRGDEDADRASVGEGISAGEAWARRRPRNLIKQLAMLLLVATIVGIAALPFVPLDAANYESAAQAWLGEPVKIGSVTVSLAPLPRLKFEKVAIGGDSGMHIASIRGAPDFASLLSGRIVLRKLEAENVTLPKEYLGALIFQGRKGRSPGIEHIAVKGLKIDASELDLPTFDLDADLSPDGAPATVTLAGSANKLLVKLVSESGKTRVEISSDQLPLPLGTPVPLTEFEAKGTATRGELLLSSMEGRLFGGRLRGRARLRWTAGWSLEGDLDARQMDAAVIAAPLVGSGTLNGKATFALRGLLPERMLLNPDLEGTFTIEKGSITNVDMTRLLQGSATGGGTTLFSELSGVVSLNPNRLAVRQIRMAAGLLNGVGQMEMDPQKNLSGRMQIELRAQTVQARATVSLAGTLKDPQFRRSN